MFPGEEGRRLVLLVTITGSVVQARALPPEISLLDQHVGWLQLTVKRAQGLPKLSGEPLNCQVSLSTVR